MNNLAADFWCLFFPYFSQIHQRLAAVWHGTWGQVHCCFPLDFFLLLCSGLNHSSVTWPGKFSSYQICNNFVHWLDSLDIFTIQCPASEGAQTTGESLRGSSCAILWVWGCFAFLSYRSDFFLPSVGECCQWCLDLCIENAPRGPPRLSICCIFTHRGVD